MAGNKFNRYLWLINLLQTRGPIPYQEISKKWKMSCYNDKPGTGLPLKTFHNHCEKIAEIFGVDVECEKGGEYGYYIKAPAESEAWKFDILNKLLLQSALQDNPDLAKRVKNLDQTNKDELPMIVECIQKQGVITFVKPFAYHLKRSENGLKRKLIRNAKHYSDFLVLSAVEVEYKWFVIGTFIEQDKSFEQWRVSVFNLNKMKDINVQYEVKIDAAQTFNLQEYLDCFVFDASDEFNDDRAAFEQCLANYRYRTHYGSIVRSIKII